MPIFVWKTSNIIFFPLRLFIWVRSFSYLFEVKAMIFGWDKREKKKVLFLTMHKMEPRNSLDLNNIWVGFNPQSKYMIKPIQVMGNMWTGHMVTTRRRSFGFCYVGMSAAVANGITVSMQRCQKVWEYVSSPQRDPLKCCPKAHPEIISISVLNVHILLRCQCLVEAWI